MSDVVASAAVASSAAAAAPATPAPSLMALVQQASQAQAQGQLERAERLYRDWIAHGPLPGRAVACFNLGALLGGCGREAEAEAAYTQALALQPGFAQALLNLGHLAERAGRTEEALARWAEVIEAQRALPSPEATLLLHALNNRGRLLEHLKRYPEASDMLRQSLEFKPAQPDVIQHHVHLRQKQCLWPAWAPVGEVAPHALLTGTSLLAMMSESDDPALQMLAADRFCRDRVKPPSVPPLHQGRQPRRGRLRLAYLSGDLHLHAVGLLTAELYELHDRERFEIWAFCWTPESQQPLRQRLKQSFDHLVPIAALSDEAAAEAIAQAGIDVLIDLQGLTSGARPGILVRRPAPVQVSYLGLPGTSCLPGVDFILADRFVLPETERCFYSEAPLYLPHCYQVSDRQREVEPVGDRGAERRRWGLPEDAFVYCSFNNNFKFTAEMARAWWRILAAVPGSVLWLLADNPQAEANLRADAAAHGVAPERLHFAPRAAPPQYLARFACADLMLDTFPYNAGTTANDALWMGLPLVTRAGRSYISRMAGSLLHAVGLPDLVTESLADYEKLAVTLGRTPARVASLKRYLAEHGRSSPLFDMPRLVRDIEDLLAPLALKARAEAASAGRVGVG